MMILIVSLDRHASARRAATRSAWKQSQCVASGQTSGGSHYPNLARSNSAFSHNQQSSVSISSGSVSSIASSLTASGTNGNNYIQVLLKGQSVVSSKCICLKSC